MIRIFINKAITHSFCLKHYLKRPYSNHLNDGSSFQLLIASTPPQIVFIDNLKPFTIENLFQYIAMNCKIVKLFCNQKRFCKAKAAAHGYHAYTTWKEIGIGDQGLTELETDKKLKRLILIAVQSKPCLFCSNT